MDRDVVKTSCDVCHEIVYADQGYHGCSMNHYDCYKKVMAPDESTMDMSDIGELIEKLGVEPRKPRAKAGEGALAQHVKQLVIDAVKSELASELSELQLSVIRANLWLQQGAYRGPRWDLDSWGVDVFLGSGNLLVNCSSLAPMLDYRRCKKVRLVQRGNLSYDIYKEAARD